MKTHSITNQTMTKLDCDDCGTHVEDGEHWVHFSVFHHNRPENEENRSRNDPDNYAMNLCPQCAGEMDLI